MDVGYLQFVVRYKLDSWLVWGAHVQLYNPIRLMYMCHWFTQVVWRVEITSNGKLCTKQPSLNVSYNVRPRSGLVERLLDQGTSVNKNGDLVVLLNCTSECWLATLDSLAKWSGEQWSRNWRQSHHQHTYFERDWGLKKEVRYSSEKSLTLNNVICF